MTSSFRLAAFLLTLGFWMLTAPAASAQQDLNPRFGLGVGGILSTEDGVGLSLRGRASAPVNGDFSVGLDAGFTGYVLGGGEEAVYVFEPQLSGIVSLTPSASYLPYLMAGIGAHLPVSNEERSVSGPVLHIGYGRVQPLQDSSLFYEINPGLLIGSEGVDVLIPVRIGLIFR